MGVSVVEGVAGHPRSVLQLAAAVCGSAADSPVAPPHLPAPLRGLPQVQGGGRGQGK